MESTKSVKWQKRAEFIQYQYKDGTGDLLNATFRDVEGVEITGNGSLQAPLTVRVLPGYRVVRED